MKRFKGIFLVLVIMLLSLGLAYNTYARERAGENDREHSSRRSRGGRDNSGGWGGPKLNYDGKTSGFGSRVGGHLGGLAGGALGGKYGGTGGMVGGSIAGAEIGSKIGDRLERNGNRIAHDKWNNKGSKGNGSWRFSDEID